MNSPHPRTVLFLIPLGLVIAMAVFTRFQPQTPPLPGDPQGGQRIAGRPASPGDTALEAPGTRRPLTIGRWSAAIGTRMRFALVTEVESVLRSLDPSVAEPLQYGAQSCVGQLELTVLDRRADEILLSARVPGARVTAQPDPAVGASLERSLDAGAVLLMTHTGDIRGYRFSERCEPRDRDALRALFASLRFVTPEPDTDHWQTEETDPTGVATVAYEWYEDNGEPALRRRRLGYAALPQGELPEVLHSAATARFDVAVGWLHSVDSSERTRLGIASAGLLVEVDRRTVATFIDYEMTAVDAAGWEGPWLPACGSGGSSASDPELDLAILRNEAAGWSVARAVTLLLRGLAAGNDGLESVLEAHHQLAALLAIDPLALAEVEQLLGVGGLDGAATGILLSAVGAAGTPPPPNRCWSRSSKTRRCPCSIAWMH